MSIATGTTEVALYEIVSFIGGAMVSNRVSNSAHYGHPAMTYHGRG